MKAIELMVGDYLMHNGSSYRVIQVDGIVRDGWMIENGEEDCGEPIPITPEILEKNGFYWGYPVDVEDMASNVFGELSVEMPPKSWVWDEGAGVISITFPNESDGGEISCENGHCYLSFIFDNVIFVHELQHALKLCGISKNIKP